MFSSISLSIISSFRRFLLSIFTPNSFSFLSFICFLCFLSVFLSLSRSHLIFDMIYLLTAIGLSPCISISLTLFCLCPVFLSYRKKEMSFLLCSDKYFLLSYSFGVSILSPFHYFVSAFIYVYLYSFTSVCPCP